MTKADVKSYVQSARDLAPMIRAAREEIERERDLPGTLVARMADAGLFSLWLAEGLNGPQLSVPEYIRVIEEVSRADGSAGWCCMLAAAYSRFSGYLRADTAREIFQDGRTVVAGAISPRGKATVVPGGLRVSGRWTFGSFIRHSKWLASGAVVCDERGPVRDNEGRIDTRFLFFPTTAVDIIDTWWVSGLRGTGSHDYKVDDLFVPDHLTMSVAAPKLFQSGLIYAAPVITLFSVCVAAVSLGIARAAIEAFVDLAAEKRPYGSTTLLRDRPAAQIDVGRAEALLRSGRAFLIEAVEELFSELAVGRPPTMRHRALVRLAIAQAAANSAQAVDHLYIGAGSSAIFETSPLERCFRDVHATTQHVATQASNFETGGRVFFGLDPGTPAF